MKAVEEYFLIPYDKSALVNRFHEIGTVLESDYLAEGTKLKVRLEASAVDEFANYIMK